MRTSILSPNLSGCVSILDCGVTYLATYVNERTDHSATIWDFTFNRNHWQQYLRDKFEQDKPDVIGITLTTLYESYVLDSIQYIRNNLSKNIPIIIGGIHPTLQPEASMFDGVDAVVIGEGEMIFSDILNALEGGQSFDNIPGVVWRTKNGDIVKNELRGWIEDINALPFPNFDLWDDIDKYLYFLQQLWLIGTRGCPFECTNCEEVQMWKHLPSKRFRNRDPKNYVEEIYYHYEKYKNRGFRMAHPFDPVFPLRRKWTLDFCDEYTKIGLHEKLPFSIFTRGDTFFKQSPEKGKFDEERLKRLADANCKEIRIGVESGSDRMRNKIHKKGVTTEQIIKSFEMFRKYNIQTISYNMLGGPTETKEELKQTFKLNWKLRPNKPIFFIYQQLTHDMDAIKGMAEQKGKRYDATSTYDPICDSVVVKPKMERSEKDKGTIQFGEPMKSENYSRYWIIVFQYFCYAYFVGKRTTICILRQKHVFFINFFRFMWKGYKEGCNMKIVFAYFLSASGDNLFT